MKASEPTEEKKAMTARINRAVTLIDDDPDLRLLRDGYLSAEQDNLATEALELLEVANTPEQYAAARALVIARKKLREFQARLCKMASDAKKAEEPAKVKKP